MAHSTAAFCRRARVLLSPSRAPPDLPITRGTRFYNWRQCSDNASRTNKDVDLKPSMPFWSVVLAALAVFSLQAIPPRDPATPGQSGASIRGGVVDAATRAPLSGARVQLRGASQRGPVLTDNAGAFVFNGLPAGTYSFVIERNGYLSASWPDSSRWVRRSEGPVRLAGTDNLENVTLPIERGGVVAGKVVSATGEPISGAQVSLVGVVPPI